MGRPSKTLISRERVIHTALDIIDVQGLNALSVELVARHIGVKAPSLYYHFKGKSELLSEVALHILNEIDPPTFLRDNWEDTITALCVETRRTILRHPNAAPLLLQYFPRHIFLRAYDFWAGQCPLPTDMQLTMLDGLEKITYGSSLFAASARAHQMPQMPEFDLKAFPNLARAVRANPYNDEAMFEEEIRAFLLGLKQRHEAKTSPRLAD